MDRLLIIFKSMKKQGIKFKMVFIQLFIIFLALNFAFTLINKSYELKVHSNNMVDSERALLLRFHAMSKDKNVIKSVEDKYTQISKYKYTANIGSHRIREIDVNDKNSISGLFLNEGAFNIYNIKVSSGTKDIFHYEKEKDEIPILISKDLKSKWHIGDIINTPMEQNNNVKNLNLKVVGFINKHSVFWNYRMGDNSTIVPIKNTFIIPFNKKYFYDDNMNFQMKSRGTIVLAKDKENVANVQKYLSESKVETGNEVVSEIIKGIYRHNRPFIIMMLVFAGLLFTVSFIGFIGIIISFVSFRKREYGIRFAVGSTKTELSRLVCGEVLISLIITNILSTIILIIASSVFKMNFSAELILKSSIPTLIISIIMFCITFFVYRYSILRKNIVDLIRGN